MRIFGCFFFSNFANENCRQMNSQTDWKSVICSCFLFILFFYFYFGNYNVDSFEEGMDLRLAILLALKAKVKFFKVNSFFLKNST